MMRVTRLDGCGRPQYGDASQVVSEGFISVALSAQTNEGEAISVTNAAGKTCVQDTPCTEFTGYGVEVTFCDVDPDAFALMSGQEKVTNALGDVVGFRMSQDVSGCDSGFALEVWAGVPGQACSDDPNAQGAYGYILLPFVQGGVLGDFTIENAAINFTLTGAMTKKGSSWGLGPYDVVLGASAQPAPLAKPIGSGDHLHVQYTELAPPAESGGAVPVLDPTAPAITDITLTPADEVVTLVTVPAGAGDAMWVEWGDGTYTYYESDTATMEHTYSVSGDYSVVAHRGRSSVTKSVTVAITGP
jgi:hypothetical protein